MEEGLNPFLSMSDYLELKVLPVALDIGITEEQFLEMTIPEIDRYALSFQRRMEYQQKEKANFLYTHAVLVGNAFSKVMGGGEFPSIEEAFPMLFDTPETQERKQKQITDISVKRFLLFKERNNAKFELKGDNNK